MNHQLNAPFIVIEGIDGAGKSTQTRMLEAFLTEEGHRVTSTFEPSHLTVGSWLRGQMHSEDNDLDELTRCYLFAADRAQHMAQVVLPALDRGDVVVCDRYLFSTFAYQRSAPDSKISLHKLIAIHDFPTPTLTIWLQIDPLEAYRRLEARLQKGDETASVYEKKDTLMRISTHYLELASHPLTAHHNVVTINANGSKEETFAQICDAVRVRLRGVAS